jgi:monofunctional biosynthetic peptidoglycan transglycosylase
MEATREPPRERRGPAGALRRPAAVALLVVAVGCYAAAQAAVSLPAVERLAGERVEARLRDRLGDVSVGRAAIDPFFRVALDSVAGTVAGGAARIEVARVRVSPSLFALLRGELEPAAVRLRGVRVTVPLGRREVELGPFDADVRERGARGARTIEATLHLASGDGRIAASQDGTAWRLHAELREVGADALPLALRSGAAAVAGGTMAVALDVRADPELRTAEATFRAELEDVLVAGARVAAEPVGPLHATATGALSWHAGARRVALDDGIVRLAGGPAVLAEGEARLGPGLPFALTLRARDVAYAELVAALPSGLAPPPDAPRPDGTFDGSLSVSGPLLAPEAWSFRAALDLARLRAAARAAPPVALRRPFVHRADPGAGPPRRVEVGPQNPEFVPIAELPEHVVRAVTTSEDAGFFAHPGFDFAELAEAFARGAERGRVVRGGSTITQQVAKNLYLSGERTIARKIREAAITLALEATLPKARILEIYLNVAEWGPGVFGIGPAARHWFGKDARDLTPKEAAFLAAIIPNPVRYGAQHARGGSAPRWQARVEDVLLKMTAHGALTDDDLARALEEPIVFAGG